MEMKRSHHGSFSALSLSSLSLLLLPRHPLLFSLLLHLPLLSPPLPSHDVVWFSPNAFTLPPPPPPLPPPPFSPVLERMGTVDTNGAMADAFKVGDFDPKLADEVRANATRTEDKVDEEKEDIRVRVDEYEFCDQKMRDYAPCLDNVEAIRRLNSTERGEKFKRPCPQKDKGLKLNCLITAPKGYRPPIPWPQSRDEAWLSKIKGDRTGYQLRETNLYSLVAPHNLFMGLTDIWIKSLRWFQTFNLAKTPELPWILAKEWVVLVPFCFSLMSPLFQ